MAGAGKLSRKVVKNTLEKSTKLLCDNLRIDDLLITLLAEGALTQNEIEEIKTAGILPKMVHAMLKILATNVKSYGIFMSALKEAREDLYEDVKEIEDQEINKEGAVNENPVTTPVSPMLQPNNNPTPTNNEYDVMISYQWDAQERMKLLKKNLEDARLTVWMDLSEMEGRMNARMAEGVEKSKAILLCFSQKYYESANCQNEASYAAVKKKKIIPLKYERGYEAHGWLGLILSDRLYYDVSSDEALNDNIRKIIGAIYQC